VARGALVGPIARFQTSISPIAWLRLHRGAICGYLTRFLNFDHPAICRSPFLVPENESFTYMVSGIEVSF
jgi:hypothetical protein